MTARGLTAILDYDAARLAACQQFLINEFEIFDLQIWIIFAPNDYPIGLLRRTPAAVPCMAFRHASGQGSAWPSGHKLKLNSNSMQSTCRLTWEVVFNRRRDRNVVFCLLYFWRGPGGSVRGCAYAHTHTHCTWGARFELRGRDETLGGPKESRWTKSRQTYIHICVQSTFVYVCAGRRDEIWTSGFFL